MTNSSNEGLATRLVTRRTVAKGAVWSIPVIASVTLAPAAAASTLKFTITAACGTGNASKTGSFSVQVTAGSLPAGTAFVLTGTANINSTDYAFDNNLLTYVSGNGTTTVTLTTKAILSNNASIPISAVQGTGDSITLTVSTESAKLTFNNGGVCKLA